MIKGTHEKRIVPGMTKHEISAVMADGKPSVLVFLSKFYADDADAETYIGYLDDLGIYGWEIHNLWNATCFQNYGKLKTTIDMLRSGRIPADVMHKNLSSNATSTFTI